MKILITGGCGFVGSNIAIYLKKNLKKIQVYSLDNLSRKGSSLNKNFEKLILKILKLILKILKKLKLFQNLI